MVSLTSCAAEQDPKKESANMNKIGPKDLEKALIHLGVKPSKPEVNLMIWEVDDDLDGFVSEKEFETM